jgi:hypothetical protein
MDRRGKNRARRLGTRRPKRTAVEGPLQAGTGHPELKPWECLVQGITLQVLWMPEPLPSPTNQAAIEPGMEAPHEADTTHPLPHPCGPC